MITTKNWGYEELIHNGKYCCKLLVYTKPGKSSSKHYHEKKHETFVVTSGRFLIQLDDEPPFVADKGISLVLPPLKVHRITCIEPGVIVEASTTDDQDDCVRLVQSDA